MPEHPTKVSRRSVLLAVLFSLAASACGYVAGGAIWVVVANQDSSRDEIPNTKPVVSITTPAGSVNDLVRISFQVIDLQSDPVNVLVEYSTDGGASFARATQAEGAGSSGIEGLETSSKAISYTFVWNSLLDLGSANQSDVSVRMTPSETFRNLEGEPSTSASFSVLNAFVATVAGGVVGAGLNFPNGVAVDAQGVLFIADTFNNRILRYDPAAGTATVYAGTGEPGFNSDNIAATDAKLNLPFDVAVDGNGNLFICDFANHRVRIVDSSTGFIDTFAGGGTLVPPDVGDGDLAVDCVLSFPMGISLGPAGNAYIADAGHHRVRVVSRQSTSFTVGVVTVVPFTVETVAGDGTFVPGGSNGDGRLAVLARVGRPNSVAVDSLGRIYVSEPEENRVRVVNSTLTDITVAGVTMGPGEIGTLIGNGLQGFGGDGGAPNFAQLDNPSGVAVDGDDNVYVVDVGNSRLRVVNVTPQTLTLGQAVISPDTIGTVSGEGSVIGAGDAGPALQANLAFPTRITVDLDGNFLISEGGGNRIRAINTGMTTRNWGPVLVGPWAINSLTISLEEQGGGFTFPARVVVDTDGNFFFTDLTDPGFGGARGNRVYRVDGETGEVGVVAGTGGSGFTGDGGPPEDASFSFPLDLALDGAGNLYIADTFNHRVRVINNQESPLFVGNVVVSPGEVQTVAGAGVPGYAGDGAPPTFALMRSPASVDLDADGNIYISEWDNHVIRVVNAQPDPLDVAGTVVDPGTIRTIVGDGVSGFSGDGGPAAAARLNTPLGLTLDSSGNIFVADTGNFRVRAINVGSSIVSLLGVSVPPAAIRTVAGAGFPGSFGDGGSALSARISEVRDVAVDPMGNLLLADSLNHRIRFVNGGTSPVTLGGVPVNPGFIDTVVGSGQPGFNGDGLSTLTTALNEPTGFALDDMGNIVLADSSNGIVRLVNLSGGDLRLGPNLIEPLTVRSIAGDPGGLGNRLVVAPAGLVQDITGNIIFSDTNDGNSHSHRVFRLDPVTRAMTVLGGSGSPGYDGDGDAVSGASFHAPTSVALDGAGNLYIADQENHSIRVVNLGPAPTTIAGVANIEPGNIETVAGVGQPGMAVNGVDARTTTLHSPTGVAVGPSGTIYVSDTRNHQIRVIDTAGTIDLLAGNPAGGPGLAAGEFWRPAGIFLHTNGNLLVADSLNHRVQMVNVATGATSIVVGNPFGAGGFNGDGLLPRSILLNTPLGVAADSAGNIFVVDTNNHRLLVYNPQVTDLVVAGTLVEGGIVQKIVGTDEPDFNGDALPPAFTALNSPTAVLVTPSGGIFISDTGNRRVRRFAR